MRTIRSLALLLFCGGTAHSYCARTLNAAAASNALNNNVASLKAEEQRRCGQQRRWGLPLSSSRSSLSLSSDGDAASLEEKVRQMEKEVLEVAGPSQEDLDFLLGLGDGVGAEGEEARGRAPSSSLSASSTSPIDASADISPATVALSSAIILASLIVAFASHPNLINGALPTAASPSLSPGTTTVLQADYLASLIGAFLAGSAVAGVAVGSFLLPKKIKLEEQIRQLNDVAFLENKMSLSEVKAMCKKRGIVVGDSNKRELCEKIVDNGYSRWRQSLPFVK